MELLIPKVVERSWGHESLIVHTPIYTVKHLIRTAGSQGPLQMHRIKDECSQLLSGRLRVWFVDEEGRLQSRDLEPSHQWIRFAPGVVHREDALTDCVLLEVSNPVFNDRVRLEEKYDVEPPDPFGLLTTNQDEIVVTDTWEKVRAFEFK